MQHGTAQAHDDAQMERVAARVELLSWYRAQRRDLPWRRTSDPYAIWVSETMLQQTRVTAVMPYYARFMRQFPTVEALASASEAELLACWAGLGYYTRARNLQRAARQIRGDFPSSYAQIRALPGVGDYTAAAVASIAFGLPHAVVDGNVVRVLSRLYGDATDAGQPRAKEHFTQLADEFLDREEPGDFNQAVMELGATVCTPRNPQCLVCPLATQCVARNSGRQADFPLRVMPKTQVYEERTVFWIQRDGQVLAWKRGPDERLMAGFWELPERTQLPQAVAGRVLGKFRHSITFHNYRFQVVTAEIPNDRGACKWVRISEIDKLAVSTILRKAAGVASKWYDERRAMARVRAPNDAS